MSTLDLRDREFQTDNLDLSSFITAKTGRYPTVMRDRRDSLTTFMFKRDDELLTLIEAYASCTATCNVVALLTARRRLWGECRRMATERSGGAR